ncbi:MAG: HupE/UreJ family protein [Paludibacter sp.]|nr:HupE/UreJ family protein [Paludibacter sp.]
MQLLNVFYSYLNLGFHHIVDINGFDHLLFIITLCAVYEMTEWRKVAVVITAFTLGHSVTLALASLKIILPNRYIIELLIPVTILISGIFNLFSINGKLKKTKLLAKYLMALFFGLIHGMSFSNFFTDLMGDSTRIIFPLFSFNVGIEVGQLLVLFIYYSVVYLFYKFAKVSYQKIAFFFSALGILVSIFLIFYRI